MRLYGKPYIKPLTNTKRPERKNLSVRFNEQKQYFII